MVKGMEGVDPIVPSSVVATIVRSRFDGDHLVAASGKKLWLVLGPREPSGARRWSLTADRVKVQHGFLTATLRDQIRSAEAAGKEVHLVVRGGRGGFALDPAHHPEAAPPTPQVTADLRAPSTPPADDRGSAPPGSAEAQVEPGGSWPPSSKNEVAMRTALRAPPIMRDLDE